MVGKHLNRMRCAFEVVAVLLEALYDRKEFSIMRLVVTLRRDQLS
jgi:hypothetical protein